MVIAAQFAGAGIATLIGNAPAGLFDSIVVEGLLLVCISAVLFVIFRVVRWMIR
ncbi:energy-converting hydrogenase Eha subunit F [Paenibacillus rhizosphaerae]|uniref:Energy-converting hydrogenase Eha subunit F n=1 Tax=Paenibacillus rhizosphaerae TaxID=297318 RepID=A0A839TSX5_9BACL|nr:energy-converting hydrogenase Eha subunit F [Paenibacillus rhizosphaerae]